MEQQEPKRSPQLNYVAAQAASLPCVPQSASNTQSVPSYHQHEQTQHSPSAFQQRKDSNSKQKHKLLSLFSKEQQQHQKQQHETLPM